MISRDAGICPNLALANNLAKPDLAAAIVKTRLI
jgi:hypothetical protein